MTTKLRTRKVTMATVPLFIYLIALPSFLNYTHVIAH